MQQNRSLTDHLFEKLEGRILSGELAPGARFPTQQAIADRESVSRTVVREATARLEARGLTRSRQGSGVFVTDAARYRAFQVRPDELVQLADVVKLLEMRLAIETEMAALAASRRSTEDITAMRAALRRIADAGDDAAAAATADTQFHLAIAAATKNDYYSRLIDFLGVRLVPPRNLYLRDALPEEHAAYVAKVRSEHDAILDAIVRMEPEAGRAAARRHMQESLTRHSELSDRMSSGPDRGPSAD